MKKILISISTIPKRVNTTLKIVLDRFKFIDYDIVVCIPKLYKKWGACDVPDYLTEYKHVRVYRPEIDYGPGTKLLGAIEYLRATDTSCIYDKIFTLDDDIDYIHIEKYLQLLNTWAKKYPDHVLTAGGIYLGAPPYRYNEGLAYVGPLENRYVDIPQGYLGVLYPVNFFLTDNTIFELRQLMPVEIFNDDDIYFGAVLGKMGIPIYSIRIFKLLIEKNPSITQKYPIQSESAVTDKALLPRIDNEALLISYCLKHNYLPSKFT